MNLPVPGGWRSSERHPRFDRFAICFLTGDRFDTTVFLGANFFAGLTCGVAMPVFTASFPRAVPIAVAAVFRNGSSASKTFLVGRITFSSDYGAIFTKLIPKRYWDLLWQAL